MSEQTWGCRSVWATVGRLLQSSAELLSNLAKGRDRIAAFAQIVSQHRLASGSQRFAAMVDEECFFGFATLLSHISVFGYFFVS